MTQGDNTPSDPDAVIRERTFTRRPRPDRPVPLPDLPAAAAPAMWAAKPAVGRLFWLTLLSTVDGSILALAASGRLQSFGGALVIGLTILAGAGSWLAAQQAFQGRPGKSGYVTLALLGLVTAVATLGAAYLGETVGQTVRLHILPKAAGVVLCLVAAEVAGIRLPKPGRVPLPLVALVAATVLEVLA